MARFEPEATHLRHGLGDDEGVTVVVTARPGGEQAELLDLSELVSLQPGGVGQLLPGQAQLAGFPGERVGAG